MRNPWRLSALFFNAFFLLDFLVVPACPFCLLRSAQPLTFLTPVASHAVVPHRTATSRHTARNLLKLQHKRRMGDTLRMKAEFLEERPEKPKPEDDPTLKLPPLPVLVGALPEGAPLLPGLRFVATSPTSGQLAALKTALAFAAVDDRMGNMPIVAFFPFQHSASPSRGVCTLALVSEVQSGDDGEILSAELIGVGRAFVPRVRAILNKPLMVADNAYVWNDEAPEASYMHSLEGLRQFADITADEHRIRRRAMSSLAAKAVEVRLCDVEGTCDTESLLELGPGAYSMAMEMAADSSPKSDVLLRRALDSLEALAWKAEQRQRKWEERYPQWGDKIDNEARYLRCFSFMCWEALAGVASSEDLKWALDTTDTKERLYRACEKFYYHRLELERSWIVMDKIQQMVDQGR